MIIILAVPLLIGLAVLVGSRGLGGFKEDDRGLWTGAGVAVLLVGLALLGALVLALSGGIPALVS